MLETIREMTEKTLEAIIEEINNRHLQIKEDADTLRRYTRYVYTMLCRPVESETNDSAFIRWLNELGKEGWILAMQTEYRSGGMFGKTAYVFVKIMTQ